MSRSGGSGLRSTSGCAPYHSFEVISCKRKMFVFKTSEPGFTLTELLITMAITGVIIGAIVSSFITQRKSYARQEQITAMLQSVRTAMDMMVREIRMTGYGVPTPLSTIDWVKDFTSNPQIIEGNPSKPREKPPDTITIASSFDATALSEDANKDDNTLKLESVKEFKKERTGALHPAKKVVFIGRNEYAVIDRISEIEKNTLHLKTKLQWSYPAGTSVELLKVITYKVDESEHELERDENIRVPPNPQPVAENIEDLQVEFDNDKNMITLILTGRTAKPDPGYTHPTKKDAYRRVELKSRIQLRNLGL